MEAETQGTSSSPTDGTTQPQAQPGRRQRKARPQVDMPTDYARILEIIQSPYLGHYLQRKGLLTRKVLCRCRKAMSLQVLRQHTDGYAFSRKNTNAIEAYWSRLKKKLREHGPIRGRNIWAHVDEAQYRLWYGLKADNLPQAWELFLKHVAEAYPVGDRTCSAEDEALQSQS
ncbi:hypothetical protein SprV_0200545500 [Sparganum proliferum]